MLNLNPIGIKPVIRNVGAAPYFVEELGETIAPGATFDMLTKYLTLEDAMAAVQLPDGTIAIGLSSGALEVTMAPHHGAIED